MPLTSEQREAVANELKKFGASLNLSDEQKQKLHNFMTEASEKIHEYKQQNPNASAQDLIKKVAENRTALRERLVNFLTPEQLTKWDAEVGKAKEFLGQKLAAVA
jgi:hypothetical protein